MRRAVPMFVDLIVVQHAESDAEQESLHVQRRVARVPVHYSAHLIFFFFFQAEDGIRDVAVTGVQTCALPIFTGIVNSLSAGTGARFSLLPPENATGNWVKVVQRVPVKILLDSREIGNPHTLRAGMSVIVTIRVK